MIIYLILVDLLNISSLIFSIKDDNLERLTQQEEEVMIYFWKMGPSFIRERVSEMPEPKPPYTSVGSVVRNLEKKKFLSPFKLGNSIQYHVLVKESDYKRSFMNGVVSNYFTGSYKEMVSFFVRDRKISKKELEDLINIIEDEES